MKERSKRGLQQSRGLVVAQSFLIRDGRVPVYHMYVCVYVNAVVSARGGDEKSQSCLPIAA